MTLTVLICVHSNSNHYDTLLIDAIKSLENQTYKNFDTLIVLDECWNETENRIISEININYRILKKPKKEGLSYAKNYGLSNISTELVCFLDGDDLYTNDKLEKQIDFIKNNDVDFLGTHAWNRHYGSDKLIQSCFDSSTNITHEEIKNKIFSENILTHGSMMVKKKCLDSLGGYNDVRGMEDWDLWKRAINNNFIFHQLPNRLYIYTLNTSIER